MRPPSYALAVLIDGPLHGYAIMRRAAELPDRRERLSTGTLYSVLERAISESLVAVGDPYLVNGRQRRDYTLTPAERVLLQHEAEQITRAARTVIARIGATAGARV